MYFILMRKPPATVMQQAYDTTSAAHQAVLCIGPQIPHQVRAWVLLSCPKIDESFPDDNTVHIETRLTQAVELMTESAYPNIRILRISQSVPRRNSNLGFEPATSTV